MIKLFHPDPIRGKLVLVQGLRALAALMVVVHHAQNEAAILAGRTGADFIPRHWLPWPAGVDIFFVISGFIIVHAAGPLYGRPGARSRFIAHRVARLVPLYWLVTGLYLALGLAMPALLSGEGGPPDAARTLASFLFWPMARPDGAVLPLYGLGWTLNYEMAFYALFALGLGFSRRGAVAWLVGALALVVLAGQLTPAAPVPLAFWSDPIVLEFAFGAGLGLLRADGFRLHAPSRAALAAAGLFGLALAPSETSVRLLAWGLPAAFLVAAAVLGRDRPESVPGGGAARLLGAAERLGDASYALYLLHPFVLRAVREGLLRTGLAAPLGPWPSLVLLVVLTLPAALLVHRWVERPLTRLVRRRLEPAQPAAAPDSAVTRER
ncbi:acyltransferase family protein [Methylorubrum aminovorans]|nr:acyltransferase [Methylorubrum aminovorans]